MIEIWIDNEMLTIKSCRIKIIYYFAGFPVDPRSPQPIIKTGFGSVTFYLADSDSFDMDQNSVIEHYTCMIETYFCYKFCTFIYLKRFLLE